MDQFDNLNKFVWQPIKLADEKSFEQLFKCLNNLAKNSSLQNFEFKVDDKNIKMQKYFDKSIGFYKEKPNIKIGIGIGIFNRWLYVVKEYIKYKKVIEEAKHG